MVILLDGPFGVGKTSVAGALWARLRPDALADEILRRRGP